MFRWLILAALACSRSPSPAPHAATEQKQVASSNDELVGTEPREKLSLPDFAASNLDGKARSKADLQGQPTGMWFFPAAGTPG